MQETLEQLSLAISPMQRCTASDFHARLSVLLESGQVSQIQEALSIFEVMRLAKERHPKILFAENVKGLLNHVGGRTFGTIIRAMDELGYEIAKRLNGKENE